MGRASPAGPPAGIVQIPYPVPEFCPVGGDRMDIPER
jgi:hypothetical protein